MHTTEPSITDHPLLSRRPLAEGAVRLRALRTGDVDDFLAYCSDPEVARCQGWQPMDRDAALDFLHDAAPSPWREGPAQVQLGFSLARSAQGRGWVHTVVRACIDGLLVPRGMTRLRGITDVRNAASLRLLSRLGFLQTFSEDVLFRGEACTDLIPERCL